MEVDMHYKTLIDTPLGKMLAVGNDDALAGLWFLGQRYFPGDWQSLPQQDAAPLFATLRRELDEYFQGRRTAFSIHLAPVGSPYRRKVWALLQTIPFGSTTTYGALAKLTDFASPTSARAIGGAVGHNPISILIPCHRVVGSGGKLTGYAGGVERKKSLLDLERG
jgi:methylated-DNA-[protein]-cysteine S-methyltransferase